tara:strand:+ start:436 stop:633 length:198 start_codon:yes stop_codon:yes gene_type:complete
MTLQQKIHHSNQIANAIQRHEDEYATWELSKAIKLPTPQVCGTMTQQRTYAMDKAMSLIEAYDRS